MANRSSPTRCPRHGRLQIQRESRADRAVPASRFDPRTWRDGVAHRTREHHGRFGLRRDVIRPDSATTTGTTTRAATIAAQDQLSGLLLTGKRVALGACLLYIE